MLLIVGGYTLTWKPSGAQLMSISISTMNGSPIVVDGDGVNGAQVGSVVGLLVGLMVGS